MDETASKTSAGGGRLLAREETEGADESLCLLDAFRGEGVLDGGRHGLERELERHPWL